MFYLLLIAAVLCAWAALRVLGGERVRGLREIQAEAEDRRIVAAAMAGSPRSAGHHSPSAHPAPAAPAHKKAA